MSSELDDLSRGRTVFAIERCQSQTDLKRIYRELFIVVGNVRVNIDHARYGSVIVIHRLTAKYAATGLDPGLFHIWMRSKSHFFQLPIFGE